MADYKDIITGTISNLVGKAKEFAQSDTVTQFVGKVKDTAENNSVRDIYAQGTERAGGPAFTQACSPRPGN